MPYCERCDNDLNEMDKLYEQLKAAEARISELTVQRADVASENVDLRRQLDAAEARAAAAEERATSLHDANFRQAAKINAITGARHAYYVELANAVGIDPMVEDNQPIPVLITELRKKLQAAEKRIEQQDVQLAGCSVAAMGGTKDPAKQGDYGWSVPYQEVLDLRLKFEAAERQYDDLRGEMAANYEKWFGIIGGVGLTGYQAECATVIDIKMRALVDTLCERNIYRKAIEDAFKWAGNHWDEWGDRAWHCHEILEAALVPPAAKAGEKTLGQEIIDDLTELCDSMKGKPPAAKAGEDGEIIPPRSRVPCGGCSGLGTVVSRGLCHMCGGSGYAPESEVPK